MPDGVGVVGGWLRRRFSLFLATLVVAVTPAALADELDAMALLEGALDLTRGHSSYTEMTMTIHRPDWQRSISMEAWTRGREDALIRFTAPAKQAGTATLKKGDRMWTYTPKLKREVRLPSSMMSQSWAGSDFSYNDLSRTDNYLRYYEVTIAETEVVDEHTIYTLEMIPRDDAPVVWGKEVLVMRDDYVMLSQLFFDQSMTLLKKMEVVEVGELGGRQIPIAMRMHSVDEENKWTEVRYDAADWDANVPDNKFTSFALRGSR